MLLMVNPWPWLSISLCGGTPYQLPDDEGGHPTSIIKTKKKKKTRCKIFKSHLRWVFDKLWKHKLEAKMNSVVLACNN